MHLNPEQAAYIDKLRAEGSSLSVDELRALLHENSWPDYEVEEAINRYLGNEGNSESSISSIPHQDNFVAATETSSNETEHDASSSAIPVHKKPLLILGGAVGLVLILITGLYAFWAQNFSAVHGPLTNETLLSTIYDKISDIETTNYQFDFALAVKDREAGTLSYSEMFPLNEAESSRYKRDQDRVRDIAKIKAELDALKPYRSYYNNNPDGEVKVAEYPATLSELGLNFSDPLFGPYRYTPSADFTSYTLEVTVETDEAYNALRYSNYYDNEVGGDGNENKTITITPDSYLNTYGFDGKPAQPKLFGVFDLSDVEEYLPKEIAVAFKFGGSVDRKTDRPTNAQLSIGGEVTFGDANFAFDAEGRKIDTNYYAVLNKLPTFFSSLSQLRGTWVMFNETDLRNYGYGDFYDYYVPSDENERKRIMKEVGGWFMKILEVAERLQVVKISTGPESDTTYGEGITRYTLKFDKNRILDFATEVIALLDGTDYEWPEREKAEILSYLRGEEFDKSFDYLSNNVTFTVWFDDKGYPARVEQHIRYIPSPDALALKNSQVEVVYSLMLSDINKTLRLDVPKDAISFDELMTKVTGKSLEEIKVDRQESNIQAIQRALTSYVEWAGVYPMSLEDLKKKRIEVEKKPATATSSFSYSYYSDYYNDIPFIKSLPLDVFTKEMYAYRPLGDDYEIKYEIRQEAYASDKNPANYYRNNSSYSSYYYYETYDPYSTESQDKVLTRKYVDGINTATKSKASKEAEADITDADHDGLADSLEAILGTDKNKADTDGDGYSDQEEIMTGSNPLGPGKLDYQRSSGFFF